mmetsp:Transcript_34778/g.61213  ORF Transcript_34778/g.61213 Transcript_34778/m.61213 type:complete len:501 (-) Transcript_34778:23-1525(-)
MFGLFVLAAATLVDEFVQTEDLDAFYSKLTEIRSAEAVYLRSLMVIYDLVDVDRPFATGFTLLNIAAREDYDKARQALAYRQFTGWGTIQNCTSAEKAYSELASRVAAELYSGKVVRLSDQRRVNGAYQDARLIREQDFLIQIKPGGADANRILGERYYYGLAGYAQDFELAFNHTYKASQLGSIPAVTLVGEMLEYGRGTEVNYSEAEEFYLKACRQGDYKACGGYARLMIEGKGVRADTTDARQWLQKAADMNDPNSQYMLGKLLVEGDSWIEDDAVRGRNYMNIAMSRGVTLAAYELASLQHYGLGLFKNCETATSLYKTVAESGSMLDDLKLAYNAFRDGRSREAALRYLILGDQGNRLAQFNAGYLLDKKTLGQAAKRMLEQAAEQGDLDALVEIGDMFYYGKFVEQNYTIAFAYYKHAERIKHKQALFNLAYMHHFGEGVPQDTKLAKRYYDELLQDEEAQASAWLMLALLELEEWMLVLVSVGVAAAVGLLIK